MVYLDLKKGMVIKIEEQNVSLSWGDIPVPLH